MKKKIGILTHYYNSRNYGGNLQAYALVTYLNNSGYQAEQISFSTNFSSPPPKRKLNLSYLVKLPFRCVRLLYKRIFISLEEKNHNVSKYKEIAFSAFNQNAIPHSEKVYRSDSIQDCVDDYDVFITGSDQVWNFTWYNPEFFLDFVPSDKIKLSYAASVAQDSLTDRQKAIFRECLSDFKAVSVREKSAVELIGDLSPVPVVNVLDPTLLLEREDWDKLSSDRLVAKDYLFCYFLGENKKARRLAERFAKQNGLILAIIPHAGGRIRLADRNLGDVRLLDATPNDFISLIKHAKYVFTDSFHAVVFSNIYQKQYFVFNRNKSGEMSTRIKDVTDLFGSEDHFCFDETRESLQYITSVKGIEYDLSRPVFDKLRQESIGFLKRNIGDGKE